MSSTLASSSNPLKSAGRKDSESRRLLSYAENFIPGGVNSPVRSFRSVGGNAFVAKSANGPYLEDVDGNQVVDLVCSWGALIHGHNHPRIREALQKAAEAGTSFGITSEKEIEVCELIVKSLPAVEVIRLVNSGTEATMSAARLARGYTGRDLIVKFEGCYHGHADSFLVSAGSGLATMQVADSAGVPKATVQNTVSLPFNDVSALEKHFDEWGNQTAAVILEVVCGNMGVVLPSFEFLSKLKGLCEKSSSLLIFDEVMTGFRLALGGVQQIYGIAPDLICLGKIIGGGLPLAAYGGKKEIMQKIAPLGSVYQAGTLSGNPLCAAAGIASLELLRENPNIFYQSLDCRAHEWKTQLDSHIQLKSYPVSVVRAGSMLTVFFTAEAPRNFAEAKQADLEKFKKFFWSLLNQGVYYPPSQFEACFLSQAHDEETMERVIEASISALDEAFQ